MEFHCVFFFLIFAVRHVVTIRDEFSDFIPNYTFMPNYIPSQFHDVRPSIIEAPFMAIIFADHSFKEYPFMTGVIISNRWILTTAKTLEIQKGKTLRAITGVDNLSSIDERYYNRIINQILHSSYRPDEVYHDIALVKVERAIIFNERQSSISLMSPNDLIYYQMQYNNRMNLTVYNYGSIEQSSFGILKRNIVSVNTGVVDFTERLFVSSQKTIPTCYGDTGSPGIVDGKLVGLLVIESRCGHDFPNVFIGILHYYEWIKNAMHF